MLPLCLLLAVALTAAEEGDYEFGRAGFGAFLVHVPLERQAELDLVPGQGMLVVGVRPDSTAARLGLQPGAVVLTINDQAVRSRQDLRTVVRAAQPGDRVSLSTLTPGGAAAVRAGTFQARQPWRGAPPSGWAMPPGGPTFPLPFATGDVVQAQRQQLADEARLYRELAQALSAVAAARDQAIATEGPWRCRGQAVHVAPPGTTPEPVVEPPGPSDVATPAWRLHAQVPITAVRNTP